MTLIDKVEKYARKEFGKKLWRDFPYHNLQHTESVVELCSEIGKAVGLPPDQFEFLIVAAWFHDLGYSVSYAHHEAASKEMAAHFLNGIDYPGSSVDTVLQVIESTRVDYPRHDSLLEQIMFDADRRSIGMQEFFDLGNLLRKEWEQHDFALFSDAGWYALQVRYLENTQFKTPYSIKKFGSQYRANLDQARQNAM